MSDLNARDAKLVQWLNEAHAKEAELEADLATHIALTERASYKKRLQQHLKETRDHKRKVAARIKKLGGTPMTGPLPHVPGVPEAVGEAAGKAVAAVKGQVGTARAAITDQHETHLRNAQEELREEHVEIAIYTRVEAFATEVGDRETAQLARTIRRDEEKMARFLDAELKRLVKAVVKAQVPADQRANGGRKRRSTARRPAASTTRKPAARKATRTRSAATSRSTSRTASRGTKRTTARGGAAKRTASRG